MARIRAKLVGWLARKLRERVALSRDPDVIIGGYAEIARNRIHGDAPLFHAAHQVSA